MKGRKGCEGKSVSRWKMQKELRRNIESYEKCCSTKFKGKKTMKTENLERKPHFTSSEWKVKSLMIYIKKKCVSQEKEIKS